MIYGLCFILFAVGLYGIIVKRNLIKMIMGLVIIEYAIHMVIILIGYRHGGIPPILEQSQAFEQFTQYAVDPLPQALIITAIVINFGLIALMVAFALRLYQKYGTFDITEIRRLKG